MSNHYPYETLSAGSLLNGWWTRPIIGGDVRQENARLSALLVRLPGRLLANLTVLANNSFNEIRGWSVA